MNVESPIVGHERPQDMIINARRKIFTLPMRTDMCTEGSAEREARLSVVSLAGSEISNQKPPEVPKATFQTLKKKSVSFGTRQILGSPTSNTTHLPALGNPTSSESLPGLLMRARLVQKNTQEHVLVLSFPRIVCDYWSSCLFMQQLADAYGKLEKSASYRPSLAAMRIENKRQAVIHAYGKERGVGNGNIHAQRRQLQSRDASTRLLQRRAQMANQTDVGFVPTVPARVHFHQVCQRENQLLKMMSKEKLWVFWESMVTATIRRQRGPNRVKVVPPVRIPSGLGERTARLRPQTSRFRPLTARNRPQTARRQSGVFGEMGITKEALSGPSTLFHFLKVGCTLTIISIVFHNTLNSLLFRWRRKCALNLGGHYQRNT